MKVRRRWAWAGLLVVGLATVTLGRPSLHLALTALGDRADRPAPPRGSIDDASGLDQTGIAEIWDIPPNPLAAEQQLTALIERARTRGIAISIAGARHSTGGHSIRRDGIVVNMLPFHAMQLDEARNILHVQAGARWAEVVPYLNARGRSVAVMQSNNSFTVGGSISVNCHGWQARRPPIAATVESFRILLADTAIVRCSRSENAELFRLALGGYGLFGVILDVDLRVVPNEEYRLERFVMPDGQYVAAFERQVSQRPDVGMAYGRLSVAPAGFLREAIPNVLRRVPAGAGKPSGVDFPELTGLTRAMFRGRSQATTARAFAGRPRSGSGERCRAGPSTETNSWASPWRSSRTAPPRAPISSTSTSSPRSPSGPLWTSYAVSFPNTRVTCST